MERTEAIAAEICSAGGIAKAQQLDVTNRQSMTGFVQAALDNWGRVDVLINNAGVMPLSPLSAGKQDEWPQPLPMQKPWRRWMFTALLHFNLLTLPVP